MYCCVNILKGLNAIQKTQKVICNDIDIGDDDRRNYAVSNRLQPTLLLDSPDQTFEFSATTRQEIAIRNHGIAMRRKLVRGSFRIQSGTLAEKQDRRLGVHFNISRCRYD